MSAFEFEAQKGFFVQDSFNGNGTQPPAVPPRLGLIDDSPAYWLKFKAHIEKLNLKANRRTSFKVIFFGRHGQGWHNVAEDKYGTEAWNDYWSKLDTDGVIVWGPDPTLTPLGEQQAQAVSDAFKTEIPHGVPLPQKLYTSPLTRALQTNNITFFGLDRHRTEVVENCREQIGDHTCDQRRSKTYIHETFPAVFFEKGFSENDLLWPGNETDQDVTNRAKKVLTTIFSDDKETYISVTGHGGIISGFLTAVNLTSYTLPTGGILPLVIKATKL